MASAKRNLELETGTIHRCEKRGMPDYVELGGAEGLDTSQLNVADSICGTDSKPGSTVETILCGVSAVRLVSSGEFDNAVTVAVRQASEDDIDAASVVCIGNTSKTKGTPRADRFFRERGVIATRDVEGLKGVSLPRIGKPSALKPHHSFEEMRTFAPALVTTLCALNLLCFKTYVEILAKPNCSIL
ncbi:Uncharacterized protein GBIM_00530 [Gryllus bimaculatus]|nr:Uncharacterized protein GBIM_00530 [Gryllus bimaculatus]